MIFHRYVATAAAAAAATTPFFYYFHDSFFLLPLLFAEPSAVQPANIMNLPRRIHERASSQSDLWNVLVLNSVQIKLIVVGDVASWTDTPAVDHSSCRNRSTSNQIIIKYIFVLKWILSLAVLFSFQMKLIHSSNAGKCISLRAVMTFRFLNVKQREREEFWMLTWWR